MEADEAPAPVRVSPLRSRTWTDEAGTPWCLRGRDVPVNIKRVEHLLGDDAVRVLLLDGTGHLSDVPPAQRPALWKRMHPYLRGRADRAGTNDQTAYVVGEFKDSARRSLLVIEQCC